MNSVRNMHNALGKWLVEVSGYGVIWLLSLNARVMRGVRSGSEGYTRVISATMQGRC